MRRALRTVAAATRRCLAGTIVVSLAVVSQADSLDLAVTANDAIRNPFPEPAGSGQFELEILAGEGAAFTAILNVEPEAATPTGATGWLRDNGTAYVLPLGQPFDILATERIPFATRQQAVQQLALATLVPDQQVSDQVGRLVFRLPAGNQLPPGSYYVVVLFSPVGLTTLLAAQGAEIGGLAAEGGAFRVLDQAVEANRTFAAFRKGELAMRDNRPADAQARAQVVLTRCPDSAIATAFHASVMSRCCPPGGSAGYAMALQLLQSGTSTCDSVLRSSIEGLDDLRASWQAASTGP